jgi:trans-aconitate methyltransferase
VHAIDVAPGTPERVSRAAGGDSGGRLTVEATDLRALRRLAPTDLVYAGYSLPYLPPSDFDRVWRLVAGSLRPGGWLAVNLFGERDSWAATADETFLSRDAARALFDGLEIVRFEEEDAEGPSYSGPKHWHVFDVIARS